MPWTNTQKQIAARACKAAGIGEEQRRDLVLRQFAHARTADGRISSTAPRLTNRDFEQFMAIVEGYGGGQVLHFTRGYWQAHAADQWARMRHRALAIAAELEAAGKLAPGGAGLGGWIAKRVTRGEADRVEQLDYHGLLALILGLTAYARQCGVELSPQPAERDADDADDTTDRQPQGARTLDETPAP
jgi:hypothetical protein